jgi:hypothetical protein
LTILAVLDLAVVPVKEALALMLSLPLLAESLSSEQAERRPSDKRPVIRNLG